MARIVSASLVACICLVLIPSAVWAQGTGAASIAGVVRDELGGVLPGVTIEVSSPVLIEKVRSTVTDTEGNYRILELRPGTYAVSYTLPGFTVLRREGLMLNANFNATLNVELQVGNLQESITVTGETPLIDTSTVSQQKTVTREVLTAIPTSQSALGIASLMTH